MSYNDEYFGQFSGSYDSASVKLDFIQVLSDSVMRDSTAAYNLLVSTGRVPSVMYEFVERLNSIYYHAYIDSNGTAISTDMFNSQIASLEDWVISNYDVSIDTTHGTCNAGANMLATCSIAKASYSYWMSAVSNSENNWYFRFYSTSNRGLFGRIWHAIKTGVMDAYGFTIEPWHWEGGIPTWGFHDAVIDATIDSGFGTP